MAKIIKFDVIGVKKYIFPIVWYALASIYLLTATSAWDSIDIGLIILAGLYSLFRLPNPWGVVTITDMYIQAGNSKIALDVIDWENVDLDVEKIHLYPVGKSWADGVKIPMKHYSESLRNQLKDLQALGSSNEE
ncbi:MAG: hypothetical protein HQ556_08385 [Candidatus Marinimicrobia bacterium]|nr:hypothetical protein [Candidatus Neomarinimicrobiota bacterium]